LDVATTPGSLSPQVARKVDLPAAAKEEPSIQLTNSLRAKLTSRPTFWQYFSADEVFVIVNHQIYSFRKMKS
jgi:hypothetical protein